MRVEIRKSGGPTCETCGATDLVLLPTGTPLERDIQALLREENARLERDVVLVFNTVTSDLRREALERVDEAIADSYADLKTKFQYQNDSLADGILAFMDERHVSKFRWSKRRWQNRLAAELELAVDDLRAQTRLT